MIPYIIFIFLLFSALLLLRKVPTHDKNFVFWVFSLLLLTFSAIRYDVGKDYFNYLEVYDGYRFTSEPGFNLLLYTIKSLGLSYEFLVFLMALITIPFALKFIHKNSASWFFSLMIFFTLGQFYFNTFNSVRQCVAVYLFFNSLVYIENRSFAKYTIITLFSTIFFHLTAILLWPLYFLLHRRYNLLAKAIIVVSSLFLSKFSLFIIEHSSYAVYLKFEQYSVSISPTSIVLLLISFYLIFFKSNDNEIKDNMHSNINLIGLICMLLLIVFSGTPLMMVINRLSYYFTPIVIVLLPNVIHKLFKDDSCFLIEVSLSILLAAMCLLALYVNGDVNNMTPYATIFSNI